MGQVTFDENYIKRKERKTVHFSKMTSFLIKIGLVKNKRQANLLKIVVVMILFLYIFYTIPSLMPDRFDGDLTKLPEGVSSYK